MPDREKVINALEQCKMKEPNVDFCTICPYETNATNMCFEYLLNDAITLLKENEPVEAEIEGGGSSWWYVCGECHGTIDKYDSYCKHCGRKVKQDGRKG